MDTNGGSKKKDDLQDDVEKEKKLPEDKSEDREKEEVKTIEQKLNKGVKRKYKSPQKIEKVCVNKQIKTQSGEAFDNTNVTERFKRTEFKIKKSTCNEINECKSVQVEFNKTLTKSRESFHGNLTIGNKSRSVTDGTNNKIADLRAKLALESEKSENLKTKLCMEQEKNAHHRSRIVSLKVDLKFAKSKLDQCEQEVKQLVDIFSSLHLDIEKHEKELALKNAENEILKSQLNTANADLKSALMGLKQKKSMLLKIRQVKTLNASLEFQLKSSLKKQDELSLKVVGLEISEQKKREIIYKQKEEFKSSKIEFQSHISRMEQEIKNLELQLMIVNENLTIEKKIAQEARISLMEKEKELADVHFQKGVIINEAKMNQEKKIKSLYKDKQKLTERLKKLEEIAESKCGKKKGAGSAESGSEAKDLDTNCPRCNKLVRKSDLKGHFRVHKNEEPNCCKSCNIKCSSKSAYNKHMRKHFKH